MHEFKHCRKPEYEAIIKVAGKIIHNVKHTVCIPWALQSVATNLILKYYYLCTKP